LPAACSRADCELTETIRFIQADGRGTYGVPRVHAELHSGDALLEQRVARLIRPAGLEGVHRRRPSGFAVLEHLRNRSSWPLTP
jgi:hypothetical protein